jgi:acetyl-CoA C-acetyltransferase
MQTDDPIVVVSYARTPLGAFQGALTSLSATQLGSIAIAAAVQRSGLTSSQIQEVIMGCVLPAGVGQAPARQAALGAKLPDSTICSTINKVCGSGMKAVMNACDTLTANDEEIQIVVAGGMESMTNAPYLLDKARSGYRMGHALMYDHMFLDGLEDAYSKGKLMGVFADETAARLKISRKQQDDFALRSLELANQAIEHNWFTAEITPVIVQLKTGAQTVTTDEIPSKAKPEKIPTLKPSFVADGTVTAANSSSIADGAAALVLMRQTTANKLGLKPVAKILGYSTAALAPHLFPVAPVSAVQKLLAKLNLTKDQIDLFEINEAFAVVTLATVKELNLNMDKVNIHGGACVLGHPIGASGARLICTLISALKRVEKKIGIATLCIGGGEATALAIERMR